MSVAAMPGVRAVNLLRDRTRGLPRRDIATLVVFAIAIVVVVVWSFFPPYPTDNPVAAAYQAPSTAHWGGTDIIGRDVFSRVLVGTRLSLVATAVVIGSAIGVGGLIGLCAGERGGWLDSVLMRLTDLFLALPAPVLAIAIAGALGRSFWILVFALAVVWWPGYARIVRGEVRAVAARPFIEAARLSGGGGASLLIRHLLPGTIRPVLVTASLDVSGVVLTLAGLSFLGLGSPEPAPELGAMTALGMQSLMSSWWIPIVPAAAVFVLGYAANVAGDSLRDLLKASEG